MDPIQQELIKALQGNLPLTENPYETLAQELGISEAEVVHRLRQLKTSGQLKRISAVLRHQKSGYTENAMVVFRVEAEKLDALARELARSPMVSHCYERAAYEKWPYNRYGMMHSKESGEIEFFVKELAARHGIDAYAVLPSEAELKKTSMVYF